MCPHDINSRTANIAICVIWLIWLIWLVPPNEAEGLRMRIIKNKQFVFIYQELAQHQVCCSTIIFIFLKTLYQSSLSHGWPKHFAGEVSTMLAGHAP